MNREAMIEEMRRVMVAARLEHQLPYNDHENKDRFVAERLLQLFEGHLGAHHPWCNFATRPRFGCKQCEGLFKSYPIRDGETLVDAARRYFPDARLRGVADESK